MKPETLKALKIKRWVDVQTETDKCDYVRK